MHSRIVIVLVVLAIVVDFAVLSEGAFRFNTDESMVGVRAGARHELPRGAAVDVAAAARPAAIATIATIASPPPPQPAAAAPRAEAPRARSRLLVSADASRSSDDH